MISELYMYRDNQWVKCDDCGSWRKLPADAFVPARWICSDNVRDLRRLILACIHLLLYPLV
jgi:hypothetical protein